MLEKHIEKALKRLSIEADGIVLDHPADIKNGDYSTNIALAVAKKLGMSPRDAAQNIVTELEKEIPEGIEKIEIAGPGFINFYLANSFFAGVISEVIAKNEKFGKTETRSGEKIMVEYTDANPLKVFHAGHVMANTIGESIARIMEWNGAEVRRACYQGDVGLHIAKALWGMKTGEKIPMDGTLAEKTAFLGKSYVRGTTAYDESDEAQAEIKEINQKVFNKSDPEINELYQWGRKASLDHFEEIYKVLGTKFDHYFF